MTLEEAIYGLRHAEIVFERTTGKMQFLNALKLVLDAAEKTVPMKPKRFIRKPTEKIMGAGDCPMCGGLVTEWGKYCSHCGQQLDWGDEK